MKNLKIIAILMLVVAVSYFLFMVSGRKGAEENLSEETMVVADGTNSVVESDDVQPSEVVVAEKSFATWTIGDRVYKTMGVQTVQHFPKSSNYPQDGETLFIFGDYENGTMSLTFPGKRVEKFVGIKGREPYFEPMLHYSFAGDDAVYYSYTNSVEMTGDPVEINITRWDAQFIEGTFSGLLTELKPEGYNYDNKLNVVEGSFRIDLSTHPLKEI